MKLIAYTFLCCSLLIIGCTKSRKGPQTIPRVLFFVIKEEGIRLADTVLDNMKLTYYKNNTKKYVDDFQRATEEGHDLGVQITRSVGDISSIENIKNFYLEFPDGDIDTLFLDYRELSERDAFKHPCYCYYPLIQIKYNGVESSRDSTITQQGVYLFNKH